MNIDEKNKLVMDNIALVYKIVNGYRSFWDENYGIYFYGYGEREDFVSLGMIALTSASRIYDKNKSKFSTLACACIHNEIRKYISSMKREKRQSYFNNRSLEEVFYKEDDGERNLKAFLEYEEDFSVVEVENLLELIDSFDYKNIRYIVTERAKGKTFSEIGKKLGVSQQAVAYSVCRLRKRLTEYGITA